MGLFNNDLEIERYRDMLGRREKKDKKRFSIKNQNTANDKIITPEFVYALLFNLANLT